MKRWLRRFAVAGLLATLVGAATLWIAVAWSDFPVETLNPQPNEAARVFDRHGRAIRSAPGPGSTRAQWRTLDAISPWVPAAFIAIEDRRFADHPGVDVRGVGRALRDNLRAGRVVAGGSTLTQQVVQLVLPQPRTLWGKAKEAVWALRLERARPKRAILEQYVNRVPMGQGATGIEAGARRYLGKSADTLSLAEAALLAGIPRAPTLNNPIRDLARAKRRQRSVLRQMHETGAIDGPQLAEALAEPLRLSPTDPPFAAPHFATWVLEQQPAGARTTLDLDLQRGTEDAVHRAVRGLLGQASQAAVLVLDNARGDVLAWVGSADFFGPSGQVDMVVWRRQPGSTLKPFVYGLGFERGLTAADRLPDVPVHFPTALGDYRPRNYDRKYHGMVSPRTALANSYNVPAVWVAESVGVQPLLVRLRALGFHGLTQSADHYGLGLALGNGEVRLLDLANAYRALANEGVYRPVRWQLDAPVPVGERVMPQGASQLVTDILSDPVARAPAFGRHSALGLPFSAAAKTGTSADFTDNWTVGYSTAVTVAVWVGNFDGAPMRGVSGVTGAGPLWNEVMRLANAGRVTGAFSTSALESRRLCQDSGALADGICATTDAWFIPGSAALEPTPVVLSLVRPRPGDVFTVDPQRPARYAQLQLRAQVPAGVEVSWSMDGRPLGVGAQHWWTPSPGQHVARVWPTGSPEQAVEATFEVHAPGI